MDSHSAQSQLPGVSFEQAVAQIHALLDSSARVNHDEVLLDRLGHRRQFDVVIRATAGGHEILGVVECKDLKRRVGTPEVNAFADKSANVRANLKIIASRRGFTKPALELAAFHGIATVSLVKKPGDTEAGFVVPTRWYATVLKWATTEVTLHFDSSPAPVSEFDAHEVVVRDQNLAEWLFWLIFTKYDHIQHPGAYRYSLRFREPESARVGGVGVHLSGITADLRRLADVRTRIVRWRGMAYYDWHEGRMTIPAGSSMETEAFMSSDLSDWASHDGPVPSSSGPLDGRIVLSMLPASLPTLICDLETLGTETLEPLAA